MIKKVAIENFFGIKKFEVDFGLKHKKKDVVYGLDEQIISIGGDNIALFPSFIAKNAAGKTSFIKAIDFCARFLDRENFLKQMLHFARWMLEEKNKIAFHNDVSDESLAEMVIKALFDEVSFVGAEYASLKLSISKKRYATIEISKDSFFIVLKDSTIDVMNLLSIIEENAFEESFPTRRESYAHIERFVNELILKNDYYFYKGVRCISLFRGDKSVIQMGEIFPKNRTRDNIDDIIEAFGFTAFKTLLTKIDSHIKTISFDPAGKSFDIFLQDINVPISPQRLSFGTCKVIEIVAKSIELFRNGGVMMIDEIENGMHLSLVELIVRLYEDEDINIAKAQLFITTHNPSIFEEKIVLDHNIFIYGNNRMVSLKEENSKGVNSRTSGRGAMLKTKNYFNDSFWNEKKLEPKSTLNDLKINLIVNSMSNGGVWQKI